MAKETLASSVSPEEIIDLGEEVNIPNYLIDETYGVLLDEYSSTLVERKIAYRTGKETDGVNDKKVIQYIAWTPVKTHIYGRTIFDAFDNYAKYVTGRKMKELEKCTNFEDVKQIYLDTQSTIRKAMKSTQFSSDIVEHGTLINEIAELKAKLALINDVFKDADELKELIKEKRRIVIAETEPKKHRTKKEEE